MTATIHASPTPHAWLNIMTRTATKILHAAVPCLPKVEHAFMALHDTVGSNPVNVGAISMTSQVSRLLHEMSL